MKLVDSNVWLALTLFEHVFHDEASRWMETIRGSEELLFCRSTQQSFLRLLTTAAVFQQLDVPPLTNAEASSVYAELLADSRIAFAEEPNQLEPLWFKLAASGRPSPKVWMDAYLAAFAISSGLQLVTMDIGFKQYEGLDVLVLPGPPGR
jgi:uncharacterized protein